MLDTIFIRGMIINGQHGLGAAERKRPQRFGVDIEILQEPRKWKENIRNTYNYMKARNIAHEWIEERSFKLIETIAEGIAQDILKEKRAKQVTVTIRKLDIFTYGEGGITITRKNYK